MRRSGVLLACLSLAACGGKDERLVLLCGSSFIPPTQALLAEFKAATGIEGTFTTGGSEDLLPNVRSKSIGDVFITHDPYLDYTKEAGAYADHADVGVLAPVVAVARGNPLKIGSLEDLGRPGLRVALSDPRYSTCGEMVDRLLERKGLRDAVLRNVENRLMKGHSALANLVKTGAVDAAVLWNGVAHTFRDSLEIVPIPYEFDREVRVRVIALNYSRRADLLGRFMDFVRARGAAIFSAHGYVK